MTIQEQQKSIRILGISGSLRAASFSTGILKVLAERMSSEIDLQVVTLGDIPLYNEDLDAQPGIPSVAALKRRVSSCHGVLIEHPWYTVVVLRGSN